ncbi:MAG: discoidin domain-containing protein [Armatimonadetes bacterium]|nr:discoidin domain-containing protein [Armatimonadota bacterium]
MRLGIVVVLAVACAHAMGGALPDAVQINNKAGGWQIFPGQGYRYGPTIIANSDGSLDMWFAASCYDGKHWDQIRYRHSPDGGRTWTKPDDEVVITPTDDSPDKHSCCDPGAIRFGGYYYVGYTAVDTIDGNSNQVFIARSKLPGGPYEKWNGKGWGGAPVPLLRYTGDPKKWGCGEPSFVLKDGKLYIFYTWNDGKLYTNLAVCNDPLADDWPAHLILKGHVVVHDGAHGEDSLDVKYVDSLKRFVAVATFNRVFSVNAAVSCWQSADGISWTRTPFRGVRVQTGAHNMGISGNETGHIDDKTPAFISYAYGWPGKDWTGQDFGWANWATYIDPITISTTRFGLPVHAEVSSAQDWNWSGPRVIDGELKTVWSSVKHEGPGDEEWVYIWLGAPYAVEGLEITLAAGELRFPVDLQVQHSADGKKWTDIQCYADYPDDPGDRAGKLLFGKTVFASRFRILATKLSQDEGGRYCLQLGEIKTLGKH